jgi:CRP/FNR family transcriptional regulator, cyclic AMP receptor protein
MRHCLDQVRARQHVCHRIPAASCQEQARSTFPETRLMAQNAPSLDDIPLFKGLEPELLRRFSGRESWASHEPGSLVVDFDDVSTDVFFIVTGSVRAVVRTAGGREVILGDLVAGQVFGEMSAIDEAPRSASIAVLNRATVARMAGATFMELATHSPTVARRLMRILTDRVRLGNARLVEHSSLTIRYRLYAELLREARPRRNGAPEMVISPPPTQQTLAGRIGGRREAVSREMAELLRQGVLSRTPAALVIHQPQWLRDAIERELDS